MLFSDSFGTLRAPKGATQDDAIRLNHPIQGAIGQGFAKQKPRDLIEIRGLFRRARARQLQAALIAASYDLPAM